MILKCCGYGKCNFLHQSLVRQPLKNIDHITPTLCTYGSQSNQVEQSFTEQKLQNFSEK